MDPFSLSTGIVGLVAVALKLIVGTLGMIDQTAAAYDEAADELEGLQQDLEQLQTQMARIHGILDVLTSNTKDRGFKRLLRNDYGQAAIHDLCKALEATLSTLTQMTNKINEDDLRPVPLPSDKKSLEFVLAVFKHSIAPSKITDLVKALRDMRSDVQTCFTKLEATFHHVHTLYDMMSNGLARIASQTSFTSTSTNLTVRIKLAAWLKGWEGTWGPFGRREPSSLHDFLQSQHVTVAGNSHMTDGLVAGDPHMTGGLVAGIMSKLNPAHPTKLDRRSTILLQASRKSLELQEKSIAELEGPGMDALQGGFGTIGSIIRARNVRKMSMSGGPPGTEAFRQTDDLVTGNPHMTAHLTKLDRRSTILLQAARNPTELQERPTAGLEDPGMDALQGGFGTIGSIIKARNVRKMSISGGPPGAERHRSADHLMPGVQRHQLWDAPVPYPGPSDSVERISMQPPLQHHRSIRFGDEPEEGPGKERRNALYLVPGVQRHQLWDAPLPYSGPSDSVERISMQPPLQHHRSIRFGDEPVEGLGQEPESSIQSPSTPSQRHGSLVPPTASQVTNSNLTSSPPAMQYDGLPPISSTAVSPFELIDPFFKADMKTARPVDYNSPSLESPSSDSLDHGQAKSPHTRLYPSIDSDSDSEESVRVIRLVKRT